jgi:hypothetical protein
MSDTGSNAKLYDDNDDDVEHAELYIIPMPGLRYKDKEYDAGA